MTCYSLPHMRANQLMSTYEGQTINDISHRKHIVFIILNEFINTFILHSNFDVGQLVVTIIYYIIMIFFDKKETRYDILYIYIYTRFFFSFLFNIFSYINIRHIFSNKI